jgi:hypothetical protein
MPIVSFEPLWQSHQNLEVSQRKGIHELSIPSYEQLVSLADLLTNSVSRPAPSHPPADLNSVMTRTEKVQEVITPDVNFEQGHSSVPYFGPDSHHLRGWPTFHVSHPNVTVETVDEDEDAPSPLYSIVSEPPAPDTSDPPAPPTLLRSSAIRPKHYKRSRISAERISNHTPRPTAAHLNSFMPDSSP